VSGKQPILTPIVEPVRMARLVLAQIAGRKVCNVGTFYDTLCIRDTVVSGPVFLRPTVIQPLVLEMGWCWC